MWESARSVVDARWFDEMEMDEVVGRRWGVEGGRVVVDGVFQVGVCWLVVGRA